MAQARLRKTFKYPDEDEVPEEMDEQEQEKLIEKLKKENEDSNLEHLKLFVGLSATAATCFAPIFFRSRLRKPKLIAIMGITSLLLSIYMLVLIPTKGRTIPAKGKKKAYTEPLQLSPMQRWIPILNGIASAMVFYLGLEFKDSPRVHEGFWIICLLPLIIYCTNQFVRRFIVEVDVNELEAMRNETIEAREYKAPTAARAKTEKLLDS